MKKALVFIVILFSSILCSAQINDTATLRNYVNANIVPNSARQITAQQLNNIMNGYINVLARTRKVDTAYRLNDSTLAIKISGATYTISIKGVGSSAADSTVFATRHYADSIKRTTTISEILANGGDANDYQIYNLNDLTASTVNADNFYGDGSALTNLPHDATKVNVSDTSSMMLPYLRKIDTNHLSTRIDSRVLYTDTASMLLPYLRKVDTTCLSTRINARVKYTDTSGMLTNYLSGINTNAANVLLRVNYTDTASMLLPYLRKLDTSYLSTRIDARVKYTDTSTMLTNYRTGILTNAAGLLTKVNISDTGSMLSNYLSGINTNAANVLLRVKYTDTTSMLLPYLRKLDTSYLSTRIDARVKYTDTAGMLTNYRTGINTNAAGLLTKVNISDTAAMLSPYLRTVNLTAGNPTASVGLTAVNGSATTFMRSDGAPGIDQTIAPTWTGLHTFNANGLGGTQVTNKGILLNNTTAAANNAQQISPALYLSGNGWGTTAGTSQASTWRIFSSPSQSATVFGQFMIQNSDNGGAYTTPFQLDRTGSLTIGNGLSANGVNGNSGSFISGAASLAAFQGNGSFLFNSTSWDGLTLVNGSSASGTVGSLYSSRIRQQGKGWTGSASQSADFIQEVQPVSGTNPITANLVWSARIASAGYVSRMSLSDGGTLILPGAVAIGTSSAPNASAVAEFSSTTKGLLLPRMTGAQAEAISSPAAGLIFFITSGNGSTITTVGFWGYDGTNWTKLTN
jgi:hypothetical protein